MTTKEIPLNKTVKAYFKKHDQRPVIIGKFVQLSDHASLTSKGMIRFVSLAKMDRWNDDEPNIGLTRIFVASDFTQVRDVN